MFIKVWVSVVKLFVGVGKVMSFWEWWFMEYIGEGIFLDVEGEEFL